MGFLAALKKIEHGVAIGLQIAQPFVPIATALVPGGGFINTVFNSVVLADQLLIPGTEKKAIVTGIVNQVHPGVNPAVLSPAIDGAVTWLNRFDTAVQNAPAPAAPAALKFTAIKK